MLMTAAQMSMALFGSSTGLDLEMNAAVDGQKDPGLFGMELELSTLGVSREQLLYGEQLDDGWRIYSSDDGGRSWSSRESEGGELMGGLGLEMKVESVRMSMEFSGFDSTAVEIPEQAREAA